MESHTVEAVIGAGVPIAFIAAAASIAIVAILAEQRTKRSLHEAARRAAEAGSPLAPETIAALQKPVKPPVADLRSGIVMVALAIGFAAVAALGATGQFGFDGRGPERGFLIAACIVGAVGVGRLFAWFARPDRRS